MVSATTSGKISKLVPEITEEYIKIGFKEGEEEEKYSVPKSITQLYCNIQTAQKLLYLFAFLWLKHHSKVLYIYIYIDYNICFEHPKRELLI